VEARAQAKYVREAPRKTRLVIDMIRGKNAAEAAVILRFTPREAARTILKVLDSAVANAVQKGAAGAESLTVAQAFVDEGPTLKRFRPRAQGRASRINKRSSHITIIVAGDVQTKKAATPKPDTKTKTAAKAASAKPAAKKTKTTEATKDAALTNTKPAAPKKEAAKKAPAKEDQSGSKG
jgi:large subunit ribosomal protein L22